MKQDLKALQEILDFLVKSKGKEENNELEEEVVDEEEENSEDISDLEELPEDIEEVEEDVRPLPGDNRKKKGFSMSITQLGLKAKPKAVENFKKKGKK
jgi:hypothetical protein